MPIILDQCMQACPLTTNQSYLRVLVHHCRRLGYDNQRAASFLLFDPSLPLSRHNLPQSMNFIMSFLLFPPKFPISSPIFKPLTLYTFPLSSPKRLSLIKSITIQSIPTTPSPPISASRSSYEPNVLQSMEELPKKLQEIVTLFQSVQDPRAKYEQLLFYGKNLKPLETQFKTNENKVKGCVSQVWLRAYFDSDNKNVIFEADSDSVLTKGLAALLVQGLSGHAIQEILKVSPDFIVLLGLQQSLTPSRNNGFLNMLKLMQKKAFTLYVEAEKGIESRPEIQNPMEKVELDSKIENSIQNFEVDSESNGDSNDSKDVGVLGSRGQRMLEILKRELKPIELKVNDVSYEHGGHGGVKGSNGETHFNLKVVSMDFEGKSMVKRHRLVYSLLEDELQSGLHALAIEAKTPTEVTKVDS